jgi:hypothetical protein
LASDHLHFALMPNDDLSNINLLLGIKHIMFNYVCTRSLFHMRTRPPHHNGVNHRSLTSFYICAHPCSLTTLTNNSL